MLSENSFKKTLQFKVGILGGGLMSSNYYILWLDGVKMSKIELQLNILRHVSSKKSEFFGTLP